MRRDFFLPENDIEYLDSLGLQWETVNEQGMQWVIIRGFPVVKGYNVEFVDVAIKIETGYPRTGLDMAYFFPQISRIDGKTIGAVCDQQIEGKRYQRWSRHRTSQNPWKEGVDDISTHLSLVSFWFTQEFQKRPNGIPS